MAFSGEEINPWRWWIETKANRSIGMYGIFKGVFIVFVSFLHTSLYTMFSLSITFFFMRINYHMCASVIHSSMFSDNNPTLFSNNAPMQSLFLWLLHWIGITIVDGFSFSLFTPLELLLECVEFVYNKSNYVLSYVDIFFLASYK